MLLPLPVSALNTNTEKSSDKARMMVLRSAYTSAIPAKPKRWYKVLYVQVLFAIVIGVLVGTQLGTARNRRDAGRAGT